jgi:hypothetical protein
VGIDNINPLPTDQVYQRDEGADIGVAAKGQHRYRDLCLFGPHPDTGLLATGQQYAHAPLPDCLHLGYDPDLLFAPAIRPFGMQNRQLRHL